MTDPQNAKLEAALVQPSLVQSSLDRFLLPEERVRILLADRFLLVESSIDTEPVWFEFGVAQDVSAHVEMLTLAFRCDRTSGANMVVSAIRAPSVAPREIETMVDCVDITRYRLTIERESLKQFSDVLVSDMLDVGSQTVLQRQERSRQLRAFLQNRFFEIVGIAGGEFTVAVAIAGLGMYSSVRYGDTLTLWIAFPLAALLLVRFVRCLLELKKVAMKWRQGD